jgi:hypothetical protein
MDILQAILSGIGQAPNTDAQVMTQAEQLAVNALTSASPLGVPDLIDSLLCAAILLGFTSIKENRSLDLQLEIYHDKLDTAMSLVLESTHAAMHAFATDDLPYNERALANCLLFKVFDVMRAEPGEFNLASHDEIQSFMTGTMKQRLTEAAARVRNRQAFFEAEQPKEGTPTN